MNAPLLFSRILAAVSAAFLALALTFNQHAAASLAVAATAFILLIAVRDYAPRGRRWQPDVQLARSPSSRSSAQRLRLAA